MHQISRKQAIIDSLKTEKQDLSQQIEKLKAELENARKPAPPMWEQLQRQEVSLDVVKGTGLKR
jgi:hypothetical protein